MTEREALLERLADDFSEGGIRHRRRAQFRRTARWQVAIWMAEALHRLGDIVLSSLLFILLSPLFLAVLVLSKLSGGGLQTSPRRGRWATQFGRYEFHFPSDSRLAWLKTFRNWPSLLNVLRGDMSFIGPRAIALDESVGDERTAWKRYNLRPGLRSLWWLRKRANIGYTREIDLDLEYVETSSIRGDFGIAARALPVMLFGGGASMAPPKLKFLGVTINNLTMSEASAQIVAMSMVRPASQIAFVNADCVNIAFSDEAYKSVLAQSQLVLADGIGVRLAGTILNQNVRENINGTDMLPFLCASAEAAGAGMYLLGGRSGIPEAAAEWIVQRYPRLKIAGCRHGYFSAEEEPGVIQAVADSGANIVLIAFGAPRQEKWIAEHKHELGAGAVIGVGGLLDFYSGRISRAPVWIRELGMEWLYRFWQEPRRMWRRYFVGNAVFLYRVVLERIHAKDSSRVGGVTP